MVKLIQYDRCPCKKRKRHQGCELIEQRPHEDPAQRGPSISQGEGPQEKTNLVIPGASRTVRKEASVVSATQAVVFCWVANSHTPFFLSLPSPIQRCFIFISHVPSITKGL